jgi:hypothetical protein
VNGLNLYPKTNMRFQDIKICTHKLRITAAIPTTI